MHERLKRGDSLMIDFKSADWPFGYALCTYSGKRKGKHIFISETYGWKYIVDIQSNTVICSENPEKVYQIDNTTGWANRLSQ